MQVDPRVLQIFEIDDQEIGDFEKFHTLIAEDSRMRLTEIYRNCLKDVTDIDTQFQAYTERGRAIWVRVVGIPKIDGSEVVEISGLVQDLSAFKRKETEFRDQILRRDSHAYSGDSNPIFAKMFESALDSMAIINSKGIICSVNQMLCELFQYSSEELFGKNISILMEEPDRSKHDGYIQRYLETGEPHIIRKSREVQGLRRDKSLIPLELSVSEFAIAEEKYFLGSIRDLSLRRADGSAKLEDECEGSRKELAGRLAHEVNNPLAILLLQTEIIEERLRNNGGLPEELEGRFIKMRESIKRIHYTVKSFQ